MDQFILYLFLFSIIILLGSVFQKSTVPLALILVIFGMLMSFVPYFPHVTLDPNLVLNFFLPFLVYQISAFSSWRDIKKQFRPIALLSIGHVIFITLVVAVVIHALIPQIGWPLAFVLGAIISPPDDVAIVAIAEKIRIPERIFIILEGEGMFNDAAALTLFRLALAAVISNEFSATHALTDFSTIIIGETIYGLALGYALGYLRERISSTPLHVIASFMTPFIAYIPVEKMGGTGIISTAIVGFIIGNKFTLRFTPDYRLIALSIWPAFGFAIQGLIFLLVGLNLQSIYMRISTIPLSTLLLYIGSLSLAIIVGRFVWVYGAVISLPRILFPSIRKKDPYPPWQYPFVISWAGIRGGISLAAALAIPVLTLHIDGIDVRDLFVFLVFSIIVVTLVLQGLSLPWIIKKLGVDKIGKSECYNEHLAALQGRLQMICAALDWLEKQTKKLASDEKASQEIARYLYSYQQLKRHLESRITNQNGNPFYDEQADINEDAALLSQLIEIEREELSKIWLKEKVNLRVRNKLLSVLDHQIQRHLI